MPIDLALGRSDGSPRSERSLAIGRGLTGVVRDQPDAREGATVLPKGTDSIFEPHNRFFIPHAKPRRADCALGLCPSDFRQKLIERASIEIESDKRRTLLKMIGVS